MTSKYWFWTRHTNKVRQFWWKWKWRQPPNVAAHCQTIFKHHIAEDSIYDSMDLFTCNQWTNTGATTALFVTNNGPMFLRGFIIVKGLKVESHYNVRKELYVCTDKKKSGCQKNANVQSNISRKPWKLVALGKEYIFEIQCTFFSIYLACYSWCPLGKSATMCMCVCGCTKI